MTEEIKESPTYGVTRLDSRTYKLKTGVSNDALYFIIASDDDGNPKLFFVNSKSMEGFQWISGLMTSYSRQIQAGVRIENIIDDMKETFQPGGSYIIPDGSSREVNSVVHHLGLVLEDHIKSLNVV